jgi:hypothetical protein
MRSLNKILFTDLHQLTVAGQYTTHSNPTAQARITIHPNSTTQSQIATSAQPTIHTPASGRSKNTMTCLSAHKQQPKTCREQHGNQYLMYVSYRRHNKSKVGNYSLRKA